MIRHCHVGSLPFTSLEEAGEFNSKFDLPALFTLPMKNSNEFMIAEFLFLLGLGFVEDKKIKLYSLSHLDGLDFQKPFHLDYCLSKFEGRSFKYQLMGPFSFWMLIKDQYNFSLDDIFSFLIEKFYEFLKPLVELGLELFAIDEPFIQGRNLGLLSKLVWFVDELSNRLQIDVYIHCCSKISTDIPIKHQSSLHLDFSLYDIDEIRRLEEIKFIGYELLQSELPTNIIANQIKNIEKLYVLPPCGLAMKNAEELKLIFSNLVSTKAIILESLS